MYIIVGQKKRKKEQTSSKKKKQKTVADLDSNDDSDEDDDDFDISKVWGSPSTSTTSVISNIQMLSLSMLNTAF